MLFARDDEQVRYNGFLESWHQYLQDPGDATEAEEAWFQGVEVKAGLRKGPRPVIPRTRAIVDYSESDEEPGTDEDSNEDAGKPEEDRPTEVEQWDSEMEDDECEDEPLQDSDDDDEEGNLDAQYARAVWTDIPSIGTDPRSRTDSMPENTTPKFNIPSYRDESLLSWFLFYMPLSLISMIVKATNDEAKKILWAQREPWKHLRTGEFLRWLGLWILMTVYPVKWSQARLLARPIEIWRMDARKMIRKYSACVHPSSIQV